jgi:hypothetical protein
MSSAPPSIRVEQDDDEEGNNAGEEVAPAVPVPPRPVLPKRHSAEPSRAKIGACTSVQPGAEPVVAVPPRPLLPKKRSTTLNSSPQLPRPTPDQEVRHLLFFIYLFVILYQFSGFSLFFIYLFISSV